MKSIAFFTSDLSDVGGTQAVVSQLSNHFTNINLFRVYVICLTQNNDVLKYKFDSRISIINIGVEFKFANYYRIIRKISNLIKEKEIDTLLGVGCYLSQLLPFIKVQRKIACEHNAYELASLKTRLVRSITYRFVDVVVSLTNEDIKKYLKFNKNSVVIPNPIPVSKTILSHRDDNSVVFVGNLVYRKGVDRLLDIWSIVEQKNNDAKLNIYGGGPEIDVLQTKQNTLGLKNVFFHGETNEVAKKISESAIFTLCSRNEGFPMVILEAMSIGLPVISFDIKTGPSEIISDSIDGFLIPDGNLELMATKILYLLENKNILYKMSVAAQRNVQQFSIDNLVARWQKIL